MNPSTQLAVLKDILHSLSRQKINKLIIINGHGGNDFKQILRELQPMFPKMFLCTINWWQVIPADDFFGEPTDHAGKMETSCMLAIAPSLVHICDAGTGKIHNFTIEGLRKRWAWAQREWRKASEDTGMGNPLPASPETGKKYLAHIISEIGNFIFELAKIPTNKLYET